MNVYLLQVVNGVGIGMLYFLLAGGALTAAFIPVFTDYLTRDQEEDAWRVFSTLGTFLVGVLTVLVVLGILFAVPLVRLVAARSQPPLNAVEVRECAHLMRIILPAQICFLLGGLMIGSAAPPRGSRRSAKVCSAFAR